MSAFQDLTGQVFGQLTVIERAENTKAGHARWLCRCTCGNECVVEAGHLKDGKQFSCGCGKIEKLTTHGMTHTKIYNKWLRMLQRCYNPNCKEYPYYGGRGIRVCERWHKFENFYEDVSQMENYGCAGYSLDRIRVNEDYKPDNVRWATQKQQANNKRNNIKVNYQGEEMTIAEAAEKSGIKESTLYFRYHAGKRGADLFAPVKK